VTFLRAEWEQVAVALEISAVLTEGSRRCPATLLVAAGGASVVALDFDARVAWPAYDWMGVAKAALESLARYLATGSRAEGIRVQSGGGRPGAHHGGQVDPELKTFEDTWGDRAPLGWDVNDSEPVARALCGAAVGLVPHDHGRDGARGRGRPPPWAPDLGTGSFPLTRPDDQAPMTEPR